MAGEWVDWHREYDRDSHQARRLEYVRAAIRAALDRAPPGPIRVLSLCAGDGRDLLGVLADHPRAPDVRARLVDLAPALVEVGRARAAALGLRSIEVVVGDAGEARTAEGAVPVDLLLLCGIFGNVADADVENTVRHAPAFCAPGATVVWTRGRFPPDLTPSIRRWFRAAGFEELAFVTVPDSTAAVGSGRLVGPVAPFRPSTRLFTFLPAGARPSDRAPR
ncbi:MAG TPA: class I SAM-dependent methyltransferase [Thermoplasmata archaeon]|nr:class I SAM-dependent methyltransferase [Thermoplasmata archaeon]